MYQYVKLAPLLLAAAILACTVTVPSIQAVTGSGDVITITEDYADFDRVEITHAFKADIRQGDSFSVEVRIDDNLEQYLDVSQSGDKLTVGLDQEVRFSFNRVTLEVDITMPQLVEIAASGASQVTLSGFESDQDLRADASGASSIEGDIIAGDADFEISGASRMTLDGSGGTLRLELSGASRTDLEQFAVTDADVVLSGASSAVVNVSGRLDVDASGASRLSYAGNPTLGSIDVSGASSINER